MIRIITKEDKKKKNKLTKNPNIISKEDQIDLIHETKQSVQQDEITPPDDLEKESITVPLSANELKALKEELIQIAQDEIEDVFQQDKKEIECSRKEYLLRKSKPPDLAKSTETSLKPKQKNNIITSEPIEGNCVMFTVKKQKNKKSNKFESSKQGDSQSISTADEPRKEEIIDDAEEPIELDQESIEKTQAGWSELKRRSVSNDQERNRRTRFVSYC